MSARPAAGPRGGAAAQGQECGYVLGPEGKLLCGVLSERDRIIGVVMHLWWLALLLPPGPLAVGLPIALWLWRRKESHWLDDQGREVLNFALSQLILFIILALSIIGLILIPVQLVLCVVSFIRGGIAAGRGEVFRYPMTFRFL
jgi:hypothetical protein